MSHIAFVHILSQLVFEVWHLEFLRDDLWEKGFSGSPRHRWFCTALAYGLDGEATVHISGATAVSQMYLLYFPQMDDNLRQSPQLPPRKLPTLKLTPAEEESDSLQRLSPWQTPYFVSKVTGLWQYSLILSVWRQKENAIHRYRKTQARETLYDIYFFKLGSLCFSLAMHFKYHESKH